MNNRKFVGEIRPSQMMYTYGVGSIVDLPSLSVIVMGLDEWNPGGREIVEPRLLNAVRHHLPSVEKLMPLPRADKEIQPPITSEMLYGAPVAVFPRWWVCPVCHRLAPLSSGLFEMEKIEYPPDRICYRHTGCTESRKAPEAIPSRILVACEEGHLDDFPWVEFVHRGDPCKLEKSLLRLLEYGPAGEARDLEVRCDCGASRRLSEAFGKDNRNKLPMCTGRRPQLRDYDPTPCKEHARAIVLGATNLWFPINLAVLSIPTDTDRLAQLIESNWDRLQGTESVENIQFLRRRREIQGELAQFDDKQILTGILEFEQRQSAVPKTPAPDIKLPEWEVFCKADPKLNTTDFRVRPVRLKPHWKDLFISDVLLVERLREVQAMVGFARLDAVGELTDPDQRVRVNAAELSRNPPEWVPTTELRGEGIFLRLGESAVAQWEGQEALKDHADAFFAAHVRWREKRGIQNPQIDFPGLRCAAAQLCPCTHAAVLA
ncbi:MAG: hypothetical protein IPK19_41390 [Chloroflexi bacterium]|nr:hypothetical protein [Chloroflexota bacterium]